MAGESLIGNLAVNLSLETASFNRGASRAEARAKTLQGRLLGIGNSLKGFGGGLLAGFPLAYGIVLPALYAPLTAMVPNDRSASLATAMVESTSAVAEAVAVSAAWAAVVNEAAARAARLARRIELRIVVWSLENAVSSPAATAEMPASWMDAAPVAGLASRTKAFNYYAKTRLTDSGLS